MYLRVLAPAPSRAALAQKLDVSLAEANRLARSAVVVALEASAPRRASGPKSAQPLLPASVVQLFTLGLQNPAAVGDGARG